jgi:hypothetical protein
MRLPSPQVLLALALIAAFTGVTARPARADFPKERWPRVSETLTFYTRSETGPAPNPEDLYTSTLTIQPYLPDIPLSQQARVNLLFRFQSNFSSDTLRTNNLTTNRSTSLYTAQATLSAPGVSWFASYVNTDDYSRQNRFDSQVSATNSQTATTTLAAGGGQLPRLTATFVDSQNSQGRLHPLNASTTTSTTLDLAWGYQKANVDYRKVLLNSRNYINGVTSDSETDQASFNTAYDVTRKFSLATALTYLKNDRNALQKLAQIPYDSVTTTTYNLSGNGRDLAPRLNLSFAINGTRSDTRTSSSSFFNRNDSQQVNVTYRPRDFSVLKNSTLSSTYIASTSDNGQTLVDSTTATAGWSVSPYKNSQLNLAYSTNRASDKRARTVDNTSNSLSGNMTYTPKPRLAFSATFLASDITNNLVGGKATNSNFGFTTKYVLLPDLDMQLTLNQAHNENVPAGLFPQAATSDGKTLGFSMNFAPAGNLHLSANYLRSSTVTFLNPGNTHTLNSNLTLALTYNLSLNAFLSMTYNNARLTDYLTPALSTNADSFTTTVTFNF